MTNMTITEKILANSSGKDRVRPGEVVEPSIDTLMMHDVTSTGAINILNEEFNGKIHPDLGVVVTPDHFVPQKDIKSAELYNELSEFVEQQGIENAYMLEGGDYGVCHVMLPSKGHVFPGDIIVGADSHTCSYGALGAFSTGIGSTEAGNVLATGRLWFRVPETYSFEVSGELPENTMSKDLFLKVLGDIGVDGALYQAMEWSGEAIDGMSIDERMTLTNMAIEAGGKSGIVSPDEETNRYIKRVSGKNIDTSWLYTDEDAEYHNRYKINADNLEPMVSKPYSPDNVSPASDLDVKIDQAYLGGCTGGKWEDFKAAASILEGEKVSEDTRLIVVPSTTDIQDRMVEEGLYSIFREAGAIFEGPKCGACLGSHGGVLGEGETGISSTNRNFPGRMGDKNSLLYLASPKTVAASAIEGRIAGVY